MLTDTERFIRSAKLVVKLEDDEPMSEYWTRTVAITKTMARIGNKWARYWVGKLDL